MEWEDFKNTKEATFRFAEFLQKYAQKPMTVMEVCGTHTVSIFRHGLRSLLPETFNLISGPGCPVCVTDQGEIDAAISLAKRPGTVVATFGDMLRVPGTYSSLSEERARGGDVRVVSSAANALALAEKETQKEVVFLAVGFETTAPGTAAVLLEAKEKGLTNFSVFCLHKTVPQALEMLASTPGLKVDGFLLPGHVSVIIGLNPYRCLPERYKIACTVAGFEAAEIMGALANLAYQIATSSPRVDSFYKRAVKPEGNRMAQALIERVFHPSNARWRGLGTIEMSGLVINEEFSSWDASRKFHIAPSRPEPPKGCRCGEVLSGLLTPPECSLFGKICTPLSPVGPCMVSSEGSCAAYYKYARGGKLSWES